jgi:hypothetical protein
MHIEALPMHFVALTDGVSRGQEHIILLLQEAERARLHSLALTLADAESLLLALRGIVPVAQHIEEGIRTSN